MCCACCNHTYGNWFVQQNATIEIHVILSGAINEELINSYIKSFMEHLPSVAGDEFTDSLGIKKHKQLLTLW